MADAPRSARPFRRSRARRRAPGAAELEPRHGVHAPPSPDRPRLVVDRAVARSAAFYAFQGASVSLLELRAHEVAALRQLKGRRRRSAATRALVTCVACCLLGPLAGGVAGGMANVMEVGILEEWPYVTQAQWDLTNAILLAGGFFGIPLGVGRRRASASCRRRRSTLSSWRSAPSSARARPASTPSCSRARSSASPPARPASCSPSILARCVQIGSAAGRARAAALSLSLALAHARAPARSPPAPSTRARVSPARSSRRRRCAACSACSSPSRACWAWWSSSCTSLPSSEPASLSRAGAGRSGRSRRSAAVSSRCCRSACTSRPCGCSRRDAKSHLARHVLCELRGFASDSEALEIEVGHILAVLREQEGEHEGARATTGERGEGDEAAVRRRRRRRRRGARARAARGGRGGGRARRQLLHGAARLLAAPEKRLLLGVIVVVNFANQLSGRARHLRVLDRPHVRARLLRARGDVRLAHHRLLRRARASPRPRCSTRSRAGRCCSARPAAACRVARRDRRLPRRLPPQAALAGAVVFVVAAAAGLAPLVTVLAIEYFEQTDIEIAAVLNLMLANAFGLCVLYGFAYFLEYLGDDCFLPSTAAMALFGAFVLGCVPEPLGHSKDEVHAQARRRARAVPSALLRRRRRRRRRRRQERRRQRRDAAQHGRLARRARPNPRASPPRATTAARRSAGTPRGATRRLGASRATRRCARASSSSARAAARRSARPRRPRPRASSSTRRTTRTTPGTPPGTRPAAAVRVAPPLLGARRPAPA